MPNNPKVIDVLQQAVKQVLDLQQSGLDATQAMIKTASSLSLTPELINRVSQIVNRSALNCQRLHSEDLETKLADIEIVDPRRVVQAVYQTSSPAKVASSPLQERLLATATSVSAKVAHTPKPAEALPQPPARDISAFGLYHGLSGPALVQTRDRWGNQRKEAAMELSRLYALAQQQLDALSHKLASLPPAIQTQLIDQAKYYFDETDPVAKLIVMDLADNLEPEVQAKIACVPEVPETWVPELFDGGFADRVTALAKYVREMPAKEAEYRRKQAEATAHLELIDSSCVAGTVQRIGINLGGSFKDRDLAWIEKKVAGITELFGGAAAGAAMNRPSANAGPTQEERFTLQLRNPQHEAALASVRTRTALQELVATDPVIKAYKPQEVIAAFNELSQYSPKAVEHVAALRAGLRQVLVNNTSLFDLDQLRKSERHSSLG